MILRRALLTAAAVTACAALLGGCAGTAPAPPAPATPAPTTGAHGGAHDAAVPLPWPAGSAAEAAGLQQSVDDGAQPWLLDPSEVALSYVTAAYGWETAQTVPSPDGATVEVTGPGDVRHVLTLRQPDRVGQGGIWVVTTDTPA